jgi:single-strand DNA-binding protein
LVYPKDSKKGSAIMDYNYSTFVGRIGRDCEFKATEKWQLLKFSMCTNVMGKEKDDHGYRQTVPMWIEITYWQKNGKELSSYLTKGKAVLVAGEISLDEYQSKDGKQKAKLVLNANKIQILDTKAKTDSSEEPQKPQVATKYNQNLGAPPQDECPF